MLYLNKNLKNIKTYSYIPVVLFFVFISLSYLYTGSFLVSPKTVRFATLALLIYFLLTKKGNNLLKFVSIFVFYLSFTNPVPSSDLIPSRFLPLWLDSSFDFKFEMLLEEKTFVQEKELSDLEGQMTSLPHAKGTGFQVLPYYLVPGNNEILPTYPWTPGVFNYIVFEVLSFVKPLIEPQKFENATSVISILPQIYRLEIFSAALLATITSYFLYLILCLKPFSNSSSVAFVFVFIYSFCTSHFSNSSQALWQHTVIELLLSIILYLLLSDDKKQNIRFLLLGFVSALLIYSRPSSVFLLTFPLLYVFREFKSYKISLIFATITFGLSIFVFGWINYTYYHHIMGGYPLHKISYSLIGYKNLFANPFLFGLFGLTFSPGFGYYLFSPFLLLPLIKLYEIPNRYLAATLFLPVLFLLLFYSKYIFWEGGDSFGTRFLTDINIFSILIFSLTPTKVWKKKGFQIISIFLLLFSFYIQYFGANNKEIVSLWNNCDYENSFEKSIDLTNLPFHPKQDLKSCEGKKTRKKLFQN